MAGESPQRGRGATPDGFDMEAFKRLMVQEFEAKLEEKEEELWRRGQVEMRKMQQEQQQMAARMGVLQDREASLMAEMATLRGALLDVTSKFELVVKDMREVLRSMPRNDGGTITPSVLSTTASPNIIKGDHLNQAHTPASTGRSTEQLLGSYQYTPVSLWGAHNVTEESSIVEMASLDRVSSAEGRSPDFCTPPRRQGAGEDTTFASCSPAVLSLATALPSVGVESPNPQPANIRSLSSGLTPLKLAACLDGQEHEANSPGSSAQAGFASSTSPAPKEHDERRSASARLTVAVTKERGYETLGMEVDQLEDETLSVKAIDDSGLVGAHNLKQDSDANRIMVGDVIVQINDIAKNTEGMLQECKSKQILHITVLRRVADVEDTSEASKHASHTPMRMRAEAQAFVPSTQTELGQSALGAPPGLETVG
mmetsp:Transcript_71705/g.134101  ORF Transcript_71705/g.134101 Transcript_71705/m.134101 type:complete len:427 (-) Transcript_71705:71-1351(-)